MDSVTTMPMSAGIRLGSAALQALAEDHGVDLLHVKGPAVDTSLMALETTPDSVTGLDVTRRRPRPSVDVDVLVRPAHVERLFAAMREHGWVMAYRFEDGSAFEHASTWLREGLASADVHRSFPGVGLRAEAAFDRLWSDRHETLIAGYPCLVPSVATQRLILILHAVRGGDVAGGDIQRCWTAASPEQRAEVDALAAELRAEVALAAGTGRLEQHRKTREYDLWRVLSTGETSRAALWRARVRAQPNVFAAVRTAVWLVAPKPGRLRTALGHEPTLRELSGAWLSQLRAATVEFGWGVAGLWRFGRR